MTTSSAVTPTKKAPEGRPILCSIPDNGLLERRTPEILRIWPTISKVRSDAKKATATAMSLAVVPLLTGVSFLNPIFRTSSRSDNGIFLIQHQGALERMSPAFGAISVKMAG